jgi:hypothetical protein
MKKKRRFIPRSGRPKTKPSAEALARLTANRLVHDDVMKILIKCNVPQSWTFHDVQLLIQWFISPNIFKAIEVVYDKSDPWKKEYKMPLVSFKAGAAVTREHMKIYWALHLARLFSEAPDQLIDALPKIRKRLNWYCEHPKGRMMLDEAFRREFGSCCPALKPSNDLWEKKAKELTTPGATVRTVEDARAKLRKILT